MKKILSIALLMLCTGAVSAGTHSYAPHSVLASGSFQKLQVCETGLYCLSYDDIVAMGHDPATARIYGFGGAMLPQNFSKAKIDDLPLVPVYRELGTDGVFNSGDRLVFYARGPISWSYNGTRFAHTRNPYSFYGYYFLTSGAGPASDIETTEAPEGTPAQDISTFYNYQLHEQELINLIDREGHEGGGREWYGEQFSPGGSHSFTFTFPGMVTESSSLRCYVDLAAYSQNASTFTVSVSGKSYTAQTSAIAANDFYTRATTCTVNKLLTPSESEQQTVSINYTNSSNSALGFLNYIEMTAECDLRLPSNGILSFRSSKGYSSSAPYRFCLSGASSATQVWDVTDPAHIYRISTAMEGDTLVFVSTNNGVHEFMAYTPGAAMPSATACGSVANQDLHALNDIDMVIITNAAFANEAAQLAAAHTTYDNMTVAVVTDQQVFNEFSSGTPDATAFRWVMKMLYDRAANGQGQAPKYLLLMGDGSFDNRGILGTTKTGTPWILTYQAKNSVNEVKAYATDDYFGFLDDSEGDTDINGRMDIGVGRLPVNSVEQAQAVVNKLIRHISGTTRGKWKTDLLFLADDGDNNLHTQCSDVSAESVRLDNPDFIVNKVYLDAYTQETSASGESYPLAQKKLNQLLANGVTLFDYCGHSGYNNASNEGMVTIAGIRAMTNEHQGFWLFASCSFCPFDAGKVSAGEEALLNANGGALAVCGTTRTVYASQNSVLNHHICDSLFRHTSTFDYGRSLGDAVRLGKNACGSDENKLAYVLLGDPAVTPRYPSDYQVRISAMADTLRALSVNEVQGAILTEQGDTAHWFNGTLDATIYDKLQKITTLDNDQSDTDKKKTYTYNDYPNVLFRGQAQVRNGRFSFSFMVPKDIRYNYGNGRMVFYAQDTLTGEEAIGHDHNLVIGGSSPVQVVDTLGPEMTLYLGSPTFVNGDQVPESPVFFAELQDEHGINRVGSGIGHDLLLTVDENPNLTYTLNEYFTAVPGSYQQGTVVYQIPELRDGQHELTFRAWDLLNNSSVGRLNFEVVSGLNPSIVRLITYPNPISQGDKVHIAVVYDQPDKVMQTDVFFFDLSGRLVYQLTQQGTDNIQWDLSTSRVPAGVYMYKVMLSSETTRTISQSGKLIIH